MTKILLCGFCVVFILPKVIRGIGPKLGFAIRVFITKGSRLTCVGELGVLLAHTVTVSGSGIVMPVLEFAVLV